MATKKRAKVQESRAAVATSLTALPLPVMHHIFSFLSANVLAQGVFRVCRAFYQAREQAKLYSELEFRRRGTEEAAVIALIQRAKGFLQRLSIDGLDFTDATLNALAQNASPSRFRSLSMRASKNPAFGEVSAVAPHLLAFLRSWSAARSAAAARGESPMQLAIRARFAAEEGVEYAEERSLLQRGCIELDGYAGGRCGDCKRDTLVFECSCGRLVCGSCSASCDECHEHRCSRRCSAECCDCSREMCRDACSDFIHCEQCDALCCTDCTQRCAVCENQFCTDCEVGHECPDAD